MLWISWEELRDKLEGEIAKLDIYSEDKQALLFDDKTELEYILHKAITQSINKTHIEDLEKQ